MSKLRRIQNAVVRLIGSIVVLLWIGVAVFWVRSYFVGDGVFVRKTTNESTASLPLHVRNVIVLSGKGGIALAYRSARSEAHELLPDDQSQWTVYPTPAYPQPGNRALGFSVSGMKYVTLAPTDGPAVAKIVTGGGTYVFSRAPGEKIRYSLDGGPVQTIETALAVRDHEGNLLILANAGARGGPGSFGDAIHVSSGTVVLGTAGPTTMGSAMGIASIAPPPNPPTAQRQFYAYSAGPGPDNISRVVIFAYWSLQALLTLPLLWVLVELKAAWARNRRRKKGCCIRCGYDLRATPGRCPECGLEKSFAKV